MAPKQSMDLLFHPKKKAKQVAKPPPPKANGASPVKKPKPKVEDDDDEDLKLPDGPFQEFRLLSSALNGWRYDVMKFDSRKPIDIFRWQQPIKLNRKDLRRDEAATNVAPEAVGPMLGPDGKPVIGVDGKMVMVDSEGRPIHANSTNGAGSSKDKDKGKEKDKGAAKKRFQRKTRQVFFVPEEVRQLRREERYPWVMEDSSSAQNEVWQGQMEDATKSETHGFFMPAANDVFKFVPAHRWYKFQKRLKHDLPTDTANVESMYTMSQKRDPQQWLASRKGKAVSASTAAMFKGEGDAAGAGAGGSGGQSLGPGGRRLKTVDSGMDHLFEDDEDGDASRRRKRELGEEGDLDEQVYEEDFADDDEKMEVDDNDEEAKETEERLKKEYKAANKQREAGVDESEEEDDGHPASKQSKAMQKLIQKREGGGAYDSDDEEKNPYASDEEEEEEEEPIVLQTAASAIQEQQQKIESRSQTPKPNGTAPARPSISTTVPPPGSRATSPVLSPNHGGHSLVAKRATSPKAYKPKVPNMSRGNSPLGGQSTVNSRATSPVAMDVDPKVNSLKRKAEDVPMSPASPGGTPAPTKPKKRKAAAVSLEELERLLIEWLRVNTTKTTRECSTHFAKYIGGQRAEFTGIVKKIAVVSKDGFMVLKSDALRAARAGSGAPSPAVVSAAPSPAAPSPGA